MATTSENKELEGAVGNNLKFSSVIQGAAVYYGATDFILRSKTQPSRANAKGSVVYDLLGGGAHEKIKAAKLASACYHVSKNDAPLLIFHGSKDKTVLIDQSEAIKAKYNEAGLSVRFHIVEGAGHGVFHKSSKKTYPAMEKFFETHLLGKKKKILEGL